MDSILAAGIKHVTCEKIRINMVTLGYPVDDLTDEEIEAGVRRIADITLKAGYTCADVISCATQLAAHGIDFTSTAWPHRR